jgi:hypothetical protein
MEFLSTVKTAATPITGQRVADDCLCLAAYSQGEGLSRHCDVYYS